MPSILMQGFSRRMEPKVKSTVDVAIRLVHCEVKLTSLPVVLTTCTGVPCIRFSKYSSRIRTCTVKCGIDDDNGTSSPFHSVLNLGNN